MKKLSLLLSVVLFSSAALFAGDDKKEKAAACKKESSCCANKKTASEGAKTTEVKTAQNNTAVKAQALTTQHKVKELPANHSAAKTEVITK